MKPKADVYLDFAVYNRYNPANATFNERRYLGLLLYREAENKRPKVIARDLGAASDIDLKIKCIQHSITALKDFSACAEDLYEKLFMPFGSIIVEASDVYLGHDGLLTQLPFELLNQSGNRSFLGDSKRIHYVLGLSFQ